MRRKSKRTDFNEIRKDASIAGREGGVGKDFVDICNYYNLKPVLPYRDEKFILTYSAIDDKIANKPKEKQILRSAFEHELPKELVYRERLTLQNGVGIKEKHIELLKNNSPKGYKSPRYLIKEIINDIQSHQLVFRMRG
jgi:hypothetical protein